MIIHSFDSNFYHSVDKFSAWYWWHSGCFSGIFVVFLVVSGIMVLFYIDFLAIVGKSLFYAKVIHISFLSYSQCVDIFLIIKKVKQKNRTEVENPHNSTTFL